MRNNNTLLRTQSKSVSPSKTTSEKRHIEQIDNKNVENRLNFEDHDDVIQTESSQLEYMLSKCSYEKRLSNLNVHLHNCIFCHF